MEIEVFKTIEIPEEEPFFLPHEEPFAPQKIEIQKEVEVPA
jgi:hypothetical protein